jgi:hypothetical protein
MHSVLLGMVFAASLTFALVNWAKAPVVEMSWSKQECERVITFDDARYSCESLPEKYEMVWVK